MNVREWALILFTILMQMSVGSLVVVLCARLYATRKAGEAQADLLTDRPLLFIWPVVLVALLASLLHLGAPLTAYRAVSNVGTSWLSREILFSVLFAVIGVAYAWMQWRKVASASLRNLVGWLAAIAGLVLILAMASVYMLPVQPAWNTLATPVTFFTSALVLGALAMGTAIVANYLAVRGKDPNAAETQSALVRGILKEIAIASLLLVGIELVAAPLHLAYLAGSGSAAAQASVALTINAFGTAFALRLILAFLGAGFLALFVYQKAKTAGQEKSLANLVYAAFGLVLVAEVLGRIIFYTTHVRIGI